MKIESLIAEFDHYFINMGNPVDPPTSYTESKIYIKNNI